MFPLFLVFLNTFIVFGINCILHEIFFLVMIDQIDSTETAESICLNQLS